MNKGLVLGYTPMGFGQIQYDYLMKNFAFPRHFLWVKGVGFFVSAEYGRMYSQDATGQRHSQNSFGALCGGLGYRFFQNGSLNPMLYVKAGGLYASNIKYVGLRPTGYVPVSSIICGVFAPGIVIEYVTNKIVYNMRLEVLLPMSDQLDGYLSGRKKDGVTCLSVGIGIPL